METSSRGALPRILALLLMCGNIGASAALSDLNLTCTNDYDREMTCRFDAANCSEHTVKVWVSHEAGEKFNCSPRDCAGGTCCCTVEKLDMLVPGEVHTVSVFAAGQQSAMPQDFDVVKNIVPKTPTIRSVKDSNGNLQLKWMSNYQDMSVLQARLQAEVTYRKKGSKEVHSSGRFQPSVNNELSSYEIHGKDLEPGTTYLVSVRSYFEESQHYSNSSQEHEFTTPASNQILLLTVIIGISVVAMLISAVIYFCYIKLKSKWWDSVSDYQNPKLLNINPNKQEVLKLVPPIFSPICVEPLVSVDGKPWPKDSFMGSSSESLESSGISTGSSSLSYAQTEPGTVIAGVQEALSKAFNINPGAPVTCSPLTQSNPEDTDVLSTSCNPCVVRGEGWSSGSSGFDNRTYAIVIQGGAEVPCESAYRPSEGALLPCPDEQPPACALSAHQNAILLPEILSPAQTNTETLHQKQNGDSGFSCTSNSSLSSSSSGTNMMTDEIKREEGAVCDANPCYGSMPADLRGFPPVEDEYQAFQSLVEQPAVSFSEQRNDKQGQHLDVCSHVGSSSMIPPSQAGASITEEFPSALQGPFFSLISADQPASIVMDSGYQSV